MSACTACRSLGHAPSRCIGSGTKSVRRTGVRMAERGERMPVVIAIGADPASVYSASAPLPPTIDEFLLLVSGASGL